MQRNLTVTIPANSYDLTVLATVKLELGISDTASDTLLAGHIHQASNVVASLCNRVFALETVSEDFWPDKDGGCLPYREPLQVKRFPIETVTSITLDDEVLSSSNYRVNKADGHIYKLDDSGYPCTWSVSKLLTVVYEGGYVLLNDLPYDIERACIDLVKGAYFARERDPQVKSENIYDVAAFSYFGGDASGGSSALVEKVKSDLAPYRIWSV